MEYQIKQLANEDLVLMDLLLDCFSEAFEDPESYASNRPDHAYMQDLLDSDSFIALVALKDQSVIGGLAAYELKKFEQKRSEIYIYDLAVAKAYHRQGIASGLIHALKPIAQKRGAWVIFVQADYEDEPAVQLYTKLGIREDVLHFDIDVSNPF
jgi:aminoglycoside 3-N-acetyltransferase I